VVARLFHCRGVWLEYVFQAAVRRRAGCACVIEPEVCPLPCPPDAGRLFTTYKANKRDVRNTWVEATAYDFGGTVNDIQAGSFFLIVTTTKGEAASRAAGWVGGVRGGGGRWGHPSYRGE
jgi:hypothetical protein